MRLFQHRIKRQSKTLLTIDERGSNISRNSFLIIICRHLGGYSQDARFLKIDLAQFSSQKRLDFKNSKNHPSTTFLGTSYSQIVEAVFQEESFCTPSPFLL